MKKRHEASPKESVGYRIWIDGMQSLAAGLLTGSALIGIGNAMLAVLLN
jgi:hypothetical protein